MAPTKQYSDQRDPQSKPPSIEEGAVDNPRKGKAYRGHNEQLSEEGNDELLSGLPHKSDGTPRYDSRQSSPLASPERTGSTKPVNAKQ